MSQLPTPISKSLFLSFSLSLAFFLPTISASPAPATPTITSPNLGTIHGQSSPLNPTVHQYLGIPFALPPTGSLRFAPPVAIPTNPTGSIDATKFGLSCPSIPADYDGLEKVLNDPYNSATSAPVGEDCLNLNVWTKPGRVNAPVLVDIYGGGFQFGKTNEVRSYGAGWVAGNEVVLVTINYRTNFFGFPNSPHLTTQNSGILDQRLALTWVRQHISLFGGDPTRITLMGHSAGAASVDIHSYAFRTDPIAHAYISQSGTIGLLSFIGGEDKSTFYAWGNITEQVGCSGAGELECMRDKTWEQLVEGMKSLQSCNSTLPNFGPREDGVVIFSKDEYKRKGLAGEFAKLPLLIGTTDGEIGPGKTLGTGNIDCGEATPPMGISKELYAQISTAVAFTCPARKAAEVRLSHNIPTYRYRYFGSKVNLTVATNPPTSITLGSTHGSELPITYGSASYVSTPDTQTHSLIKYMQSIWSTFAADPSAGLTKAPLKIPRYTPLWKTLVKLAWEQDDYVRLAQGKDVVSTAWPVEWDAICAIIDLVPDSVWVGGAPTKREEAVDILAFLQGLGKEEWEVLGRWIGLSVQGLRY